MCQVYVVAHKKASIARHKFDNLPKISQKNLTVLVLKSAIIRNLVILYLSLNVRKILAKIGWFLRVCLILCLREFCGYGSYGYQYQVSRSIKLFIQF